jgi:hypothetical protein
MREMRQQQEQAEAIEPTANLPAVEPLPLPELAAEEISYGPRLVTTCAATIKVKPLHWLVPESRAIAVS